MNDHQQMIADCEAREERLTEWEVGFIDSIGRQIADHPLTYTQAAKLESIWDRVTEKG